MAVTKTDVTSQRLIINRLSKAQYDAAKEAGTLSDTELYLVRDDDEYVKQSAFTALANSVLYYAEITA